METARKDVKRDKRDVRCVNSTILGYSSTILHTGDMFTYHEHCTDGTYSTMIAVSHGRVKPIGGDKYMILAQTMSSNGQFSYERWVDPTDVTETHAREKCNPHMLAFFESTEDYFA